MLVLVNRSPPLPEHFLQYFPLPERGARTCRPPPEYVIVALFRDYVVFGWRRGQDPLEIQFPTDLRLFYLEILRYQCVRWKHLRRCSCPGDIYTTYNLPLAGN